MVAYLRHSMMVYDRGRYIAQLDRSCRLQTADCAHSLSCSIYSDDDCNRAVELDNIHALVIERPDATNGELVEGGPRNVSVYRVMMRRRQRDLLAAVFSHSSE